MANLQLKGIDDILYQQIKNLAASENRSVSQQVLYLIKRYMANRKSFQTVQTPAEVFLSLAGSWEDQKTPEETILEIKKARRNSDKLNKGF
ncbi:MAG: hypothetical protein GY866_25165 [Proteobacteria bacterium]|nr:hypothetical protein [Pseudomonadota bacterium]